MKITGNYWDVLFALLVIVIAFTVRRIQRLVIDRLVMGASTRLKVDLIKYSLLKNAVKFIVYFSALIIISNSILALKHYGTAFFAGAGVLAAIVGFASQNAFSNINSGILLVIFRDFSVVDRVKVGQLYTGNANINSTLIDDHVCMSLESGIKFNSEIDLAMRLMEKEALRHPERRVYLTVKEIRNGEPQVVASVIQISETAIQLRAYAWAKDHTSGFILKYDLLRNIKLRFDAEGVKLAHPYYRVQLQEAAFKSN